MQFGYFVPDNVNQLFPIKFELDAPYLFRHMHHAYVHAICMPNVMSLGLAYNVNHVIMMSLAFMFHSCHVQIRWHDGIGVHIS